MLKPEIKAEKHSKRNRIIFALILLAYILTMIYVSIQMFSLDSDELSDSGRSVGDYAFMLLECVLGLLLMFLPSIVARRLTINIPLSLYLIYVIFIFCAIYLGEVWHFFYRYAYWDTMLHSFSSIALGTLGFVVVSFLNKDEHVTLSLSPFFVAFFAFCFGFACGALWEICEFTVDSVFGLNMQKFALEDGTNLIGQAALSDTMEDLVIDFIGALIASVVGYFTIKRKRSELVGKDAKG